MSEHESTTGGRVQELASGFSPGQQAGVATAASLVTGGLLAALGLALDLTRDEVIVAVAGLGLLVLVGVVHAFFRAMLLSAEESEGDPFTALTYPLFPVLFLFLAVAVGLFVGVYMRYM